MSGNSYNYPWDTTAFFVRKQEQRGWASHPVSYSEGRIRIRAEVHALNSIYTTSSLRWQSGQVSKFHSLRDLYWVQRGKNLTDIKVLVICNFIIVKRSFYCIAWYLIVDNFGIAVQPSPANTWFHEIVSLETSSESQILYKERTWRENARNLVGAYLPFRRTINFKKLQCNPFWDLHRHWEIHSWRLRTNTCQWHKLTRDRKMLLIIYS